MAPAVVMTESWGKLSHLYITVFLAYFPQYLVYPAITDIIVAAVCGSEKECSLAIYLAGGQQAITGLGCMLVTPLLGSLSDVYGRKYLLTNSSSSSSHTTIIINWEICAAIMALSLSTNFFYAYFAIKTFTDMAVTGGVLCLSLGYLADNVTEVNRVGAFGVLNGILCVANVCGTLTAGLLSISRIFQLATALAIVGTIYMRVFLEEKSREKGDMKQPILNLETETSKLGPRKKDSFNGFPSPKDIYALLKSSTIFALATSVSFFTSAAEAGYTVFLMYFLKARFGFDKDQFSVVLLITNVGSTLTNVFLMPLLGPFIGEETLLCFGLLNGFLSMSLDSIAWAPWVPYFSALLGMFFSLSSSCIRSIISKQIGPNEQGIAQGSLMSTAALANIIAPLVFSPLSALFLSEEAPFYFPGFCILCIGFTYLIGLILSVIIKMRHSSSRDSNQLRERGSLPQSLY